MEVILGIVIFLGIVYLGDWLMSDGPKDILRQKRRNKKDYGYERKSSKKDW